MRIKDLIRELIASRGAKISFIPIEANDDGIYEDSIRKFVLNYFWTGVLIEPHPEVFCPENTTTST
jgi:hypothetical protein